MIIGTGIDIVNIERIERLSARWEDLFLSRVFTEKERIRCLRQARSSECFAIRFAAKEAFLKAIGSGLRDGIHWTDVEVLNDSRGKPYFSFHRRAKDIYETLRVRQAFLTLSHDRPYAVAHVILEGKGNEGGEL